MGCKKILCDGFASYRDIIFLEGQLTCFLKSSCCASYKAKVIVAVALSFFMGFFKPILIPLTTTLALLFLPIQGIVAFLRSRKCAHYLVTWVLCLLTTVLIVGAISCLFVFAATPIFLSVLGISIAFCAVTSFVHISDRLIFSNLPTPPPNTSSCPILIIN